MATAEQTLTEARRWIGTRETPNGSNRVPGITDWYGLVGAWCAMYVSRVLVNAGLPVGPGPKGAAWVSSLIGWYRQQGRTFTNARQAQPGDLVAFEWGTTAGGYDHVGIVESVRSDGLVTIEGNVGNRCDRFWRPWSSGFAEFARPAYSTSPPPISTPGPATVWRQGDRGDYVAAIQRIVTHGSPVTVVIDGVYGPATTTAVRSWQRRLNLTPDGVWGPVTARTSEDLFRWLNSTSQPAGDVAAALEFIAAAKRSTLRQGNTGPFVRFAQERLVANGVPVGPRGGAADVDGTFGPATHHAVIHFQRAHGLTADGVIGPRTWARLVGS